MVHQSPSQTTKHELLIDITQPRRKIQVTCLALTVLVVVLFVTRDWIGAERFCLTRRFFEEVDPIDKPLNDATITAWVRRAWKYSESTKANENAKGSAASSSSVKQHSQKQSSETIVCYYTVQGNLNTSRELRPSHIDPHICTHIIVGFARVVNCTLSLGETSWVYERVAALKNHEPGLKVMVSAGSMDELHSGFPEMVLNHANRKTFIKSVLNITKTFDLDGLDIDWEFPAWTTDDVRQRIHFVQLIQELRKEFDQSSQKLILSVAVAAPQAIVDLSYNIPALAEYVDFINLMSYDFHYYIWYYPVTGLNAPLFPASTETGYLSTLNVNFSALYWVSKNMPRDKIIIGIPTYGHSYKLVNSANHDLQAPSSGLGNLGMDGFVPYSDICTFLKNGAERVFVNESKVPYSYKDTEWVSYDDVESVTHKVNWIRSQGFKGAMILSLNTDDWNSTCQENVKFPLTRAVYQVLKLPSGVTNFKSPL
ncbi:chitinase-3-like protein 2 [Orussus abietinus]|uniref:chitinase-3-like protein 2 n=1 Tax=Orussus abietinus TaxID=222816 RepID=UPI00062611FD|nr:chitinase-3-like protein 2 [Orussus abietinus]